MFVTQYICKEFLCDVTDKTDQTCDYETEKKHGKTGRIHHSECGVTSKLLGVLGM